MGLCLGCYHETFERTYNDGTKDFKVRGVRYNMEQSLLDCVQHYEGLCKKHGYQSKLTHVDTPFVDTAKIEPDLDKDGEDGVLASAAASVLMKLLYSAKLARFDILKAISNLASRLTKWNRRCDKQLNRLIAYVKSTAHEL